MISDKQVKKYMRCRLVMTKEKAAAKCGISANTARKYEKLNLLPSEIQSKPRNEEACHSFVKHWDEISGMLKESPSLMGKTILGYLIDRYPGEYKPSQIRGLQRQMQKWRIESGKDKEVRFPQHIRPGIQSQSDYTVMNELNITINTQHFKHILYHFMLPYSLWEDIMICYSESFETLTKGYEQAVFKLGGVMSEHRTDNLSAATKRMGCKRTFTESWKQFLKHYDVNPSRNNPGQSHENGSIEKSNDLIKKAIDQELMLRGSRDFRSISDYNVFIDDIVKRRNKLRAPRISEEEGYLYHLPTHKWYAPKVTSAKVTNYSLINVENVIYSVPSRLIGSQLTVHILHDEIRLLFGRKCIHTMQKYQSGPVIDYRHIIDSLIKKPGAFLNYQYRENLFPRKSFRLAYDKLCDNDVKNGHKHYLKLLKEAKMSGESEVSMAIDIILEDGGIPLAATVKGLVYLPKPSPTVEIKTPSLEEYDNLLTGNVE
jgi:hypothetical protein